MQKKILFGVKIIALFGLAFFFVLHIIMPQYPYAYLAAYVDKLERENSISEPKIILMGDSNVAYGIRSNMLEEAIGMPVVNMGMHAGLGQTFCMDLAKKGIQEGDIVVIMPAYYSDADGLKDGTLAWMMLENKLGLIFNVRICDFPALIKGFPAYFKRAVECWKNGLGGIEHTRESFNHYGDISAASDTNIMEEGWLPSYPFETEINIELMDYYNEYNQFVQKKGARMVMASMPIIDLMIDGRYDEVIQRQERVIEKLDFPVISDWGDYVYPAEYFYDTNYHLNDRGADVRTKQLINDLKSWMEQSGDMSRGDLKRF